MVVSRLKTVGFIGLSVNIISYQLEDCNRLDQERIVLELCLNETSGRVKSEEDAL